MGPPAAAGAAARVRRARRHGPGPDGDAAPTQAQDPSALDGLALRTPTFSLLAADWLAISMLVTTLHFYQVSILTLQGIEGEVAARVFSLSALAMVLTMPLVGRMFDRFRTRFVSAAGLLVVAAALVGVTLVRDLASPLPYEAIFGVTNAFSMSSRSTSQRGPSSRRGRRCCHYSQFPSPKFPSPR